MTCFEVFRNGERLAIAGIGDYGVMSTIIDWVSHHPEKGARWKEHSDQTTDLPELSLSVGGLTSPESGPAAQLDWEKCRLNVGDEVIVRIVEHDHPDTAKSHVEVDRVRDTELEKKYVLRKAKEFGWNVQMPPIPLSTTEG